MTKVLTVVGARPQFIKSSVISRAIKKSGLLSEVIVHTGQHFDEHMSGIFFSELDIPEPKYNLGISSLSHAAMTGRMLEKIEEIILTEDPDLVLLYGDTNSTLAGVIASKKLQKPVAHVEAGVRSFDMRIPEEVNRILTDRVSDILYCPTDKAVANLKKEGFDDLASRVVYSGDVMYDSVLYFCEKLSTTPFTIIPPERFALCTVHRAENTDDPEKLRHIFAALNEISLEMDIILPIHPRTRPLLKKYGITTNASLIGPVGYIEMLGLIDRCTILLTDSGGLPKEAFFLGKYCITLRDTTEWTELVDGGFTSLAGTNTDAIVDAFHAATNANPDYSARPYGSGNAGELIVADLEASFA